MFSFLKYVWKTGFFNRIAKIWKKDVSKYIRILFDDFRRNIGALKIFGSSQL